MKKPRIINGKLMGNQLDRFGDKMDINHIDVEEFMLNPVLRLGSGNNAPVIGRILKMGQDVMGDIKFEAEIFQNSVDKADEVWKLINNGLLRGISYGGVVKKSERNSHTPNVNVIKEFELHEVSLFDMLPHPNILEIGELETLLTPLERMQEHRNDERE